MPEVYVCAKKECEKPVCQDDEFVHFPAEWFGGTMFNSEKHYHHSCYVSQQQERDREELHQQHLKEANRAIYGSIFNQILSIFGRRKVVG